MNFADYYIYACLISSVKAVVPLFSNSILTFPLGFPLTNLISHKYRFTVVPDHFTAFKMSEKSIGPLTSRL
ncbi:hypothetical protein CS542_01675 [Pedobacter sp. IW39]|nr:hypothetical protein CS542_01675 [Pedobacter sp. IW39]